MSHIPTPTFGMRTRFIKYTFILLIFIFLKNDFNVSCSNNVPSDETTPPLNFDDLVQYLPPEKKEAARNLYDGLRQALINKDVDLEEKDAQLKRKDADLKLLRAKSYHTGFVCALDSMSAQLDEMFKTFGLNSINLPKSTSYDHFPSSVRNILDYSDIGYNHPLRRVGLVSGRFSHDKPEKTNQSFVKWSMVLEGDSRIRSPKLAEKLRTKVTQYYEANKAKHVGESDYHNITVFNHYFAGVMTRFYKLGNLVKHNVLEVLSPSPMQNYDYNMLNFDDKTSTSRNNEYFCKTLLHYMPYWYLTEEHVELLNIMYSLFHVTPMEIGVKIVNRRNQTVVIPKSECLVMEDHYL